jgi:hypothetical protein
MIKNPPVDIQNKASGERVYSTHSPFSFPSQRMIKSSIYVTEPGKYVTELDTTLK